MIRYLWLAVSLAAAMVFAAPLYEKLPTLLDMLNDGTLQSSYSALLTSNTQVRQAGVILTGLVIATVMGFGILALVEGVLVATCQARLKRDAAEALTHGPITERRFRESFAQAPFLADIAEKYIRQATTFMSAEGKARRNAAESSIVAWSPAAQYFGPSHLVDNRLFWSLFGPLPGATLGVGLTLISIVYVRPGGTGSIDPLTVAAAITALTFAATTLIYFFTRAVRHTRRIQAIRFSAELDSLLNLPAPQQQLHELTQLARAEQSAREAALRSSASSGFESELRKMIQELSDTARQITADQSHQVQQLMHTTLNHFIGDLENQITGHAKIIDQSLTAAASAAEKMEKGISETSKTFMKTARAQSQELIDALQKSATALAEFESRSRTDLSGELKELAAKLESIAASIKPMVEEVKANQTALLETVKGDASSAKAISEAAHDMNAAAKAGKETLEGFVTLAKELQEAVRIFTAGLPETMPAPLQPAAEPAAAPRAMDKSIGEELRKLQALTASRTLPKL